MKTVKEEENKTTASPRRLLPQRGVSLAQKIFFAENLRVMIRAGLSYTQAFKTLVLQAEQRRWKSILEDVSARIERGEQFADALGHHPEFPPLFVNMVRVGEVSGTLEHALEELSMQMKKELMMRTKIRGAMLYPMIILAATLLIGIGMLVFVIPKIISVFRDINAELPLATRVLIAVSDAVTQHGLILGISVVAVVAVLVTLARTKQGTAALHVALLRFWIIGPIVRNVNIARMTRTLATLLRTNIPVVDAFTITADVLGNVHYRHALRAAADKLKTGTGITEVFAAYPTLFPPLVVQMTTVGEQAGKLDDMFGELAAFYEANVDETLSNLTQIIEPLLILFLGAAVGGIAVAIISPIYALSEKI